MLAMVLRARPSQGLRAPLLLTRAATRAAVLWAPLRRGSRVLAALLRFLLAVARRALLSILAVGRWSRRLCSRAWSQVAWRRRAAPLLMGRTFALVPALRAQMLRGREIVLAAARRVLPLLDRTEALATV